MSSNNRNRLKTTVSAVASSGLGAFTISTASSGYRSFVAGDDGLTFDGVLITEGTTWEVRDGCVYTHSGTSLSRGTLMDSSTGSAIAFTSAAVVTQGGTAGTADTTALMKSVLSGLTLSFRVPTAYRAWQGVCWWRDHVIVTSDRDSSFAISNTIGIYEPNGTLVTELTSAYTGTDPGGKKMSFGSPYVLGDFLYVTAYNLNDGGSPLISRVLRYTLNPSTKAVALDTSFGTSGVQSIGSDTAEQVSFINGEWYVCYHDQTYIRRLNTSWVSQGTMSLSQAFPSGGGPQAMIWEDSEATVYLVMHGPNANGSTRSSELHKYTRSGSTLTYVSTLSTPGYGLTQGASAGPLGYVWADRPNNRVWFTPKLIETPLRAHSPRVYQTDLYKPSLQNSWVDFDASYDRTAKVYHDVQSGRVWLEGMIKNGTTTTGTVLFSVPAHMRPKFSKNFPVVSNLAFGYIGIVGNNKASGTAGDVFIGAGSATWLSLDGVSWQVDD